MKQAPDEIYLRLLTHAIGESEAINARGGEQGGQPQMGSVGQAPSSSPFPASASGMGKSANPNMIQGGGQVPMGRALGNG
jgi:hypothetical protein